MPQVTHFEKLSFCNGGNLKRIFFIYQLDVQNSKVEK